MVLCIVCGLHPAENHMPQGLKMALSASGTLSSPASRMSSILQMGWHTKKEHVNCNMLIWDSNVHGKVCIRLSVFHCICLA